MEDFPRCRLRQRNPGICANGTRRVSVSRYSSRWTTSLRRTERLDALGPRRWKSSGSAPALRLARVPGWSRLRFRVAPGGGCGRRPPVEKRVECPNFVLLLAKAHFKTRIQKVLACRSSSHRRRGDRAVRPARGRGRCVSCGGAKNSVGEATIRVICVRLDCILCDLPT
jgi:hypothetical protein